MSEILDSLFNSNFLESNSSIKEKLDLKLARTIGSLEPAFSHLRYSNEYKSINPIDLYQNERHNHIENLRKSSIMESLNLNSPSLSKIISTNKMISEVFDLDKKKTLNEERWGEVIPPVPPREKPKKKDEDEEKPSSTASNISKAAMALPLVAAPASAIPAIPSLAALGPAALGAASAAAPFVVGGGLAVGAGALGAAAAASVPIGLDMLVGNMNRRHNPSSPWASEVRDSLLGRRPLDPSSYDVPRVLPKLPPLRIPSSDAAPVAPPAPAIPTDPDAPLPMPAEGPAPSSPPPGKPPNWRDDLRTARKWYKDKRAKNPLWRWGHRLAVGTGVVQALKYAPPIGGGIVGAVDAIGGHLRGSPPDSTRMDKETTPGERHGPGRTTGKKPRAQNPQPAGPPTAQNDDETKKKRLPYVLAGQQPQNESMYGMAAAAERFLRDRENQQSELLSNEPENPYSVDKDGNVTQNQFNRSQHISDTSELENMIGRNKARALAKAPNTGLHAPTIMMGQGDDPSGYSRLGAQAATDKGLDPNDVDYSHTNTIGLMSPGFGYKDTPEYKRSGYVGRTTAFPTSRRPRI